MFIECDVLVIGGGVAGMSAAISAARLGAQTLLLEEDSELGGVLRAGLGFPVCGLFDSRGSVLNAGISHELLDAVGWPSTSVGRLHVLAAHADVVLSFFDQALCAQTALAIETKCTVTGVEERNATIRRVITSCGTIDPKAVVDCSGCGAVIKRSSASSLPSGGKVLAGYAVRLRGVEHDPVLSLKVAFVLRKASLGDGLQFSTLMPPDCLKLAVRPDIAEDSLQRGVNAVVEILRQELPEFRQVEIVEQSQQLLQREGVRLRGEYVLTEDDVLGGARFPDGIAKSAWPVEYWDAENGQQLEYLSDGDFYEIPLRCLRSAKIGNLFAAGRCISATSRALASARVMGTCIATGEAAGKAAAEQCL